MQRQLELGFIPLEQRLRRLRQRSRRAARHGTLMGAIGAGFGAALLLLVCLALLLGGLAMYSQLGPQFSSLPLSLKTILLLELLLVPPALLFGLGRAITQLLTIGRLYPYYYRDELAWLEQRGAALHYIGEDFHRLLEADRDASLGWMQLFMPQQKRGKLEQQLDYLACSGALLRRSAFLRPVRSRFEFAWASRLCHSQFVFHWPFWLWLMCIMLGFLLFIAIFAAIFASAISGAARTPPAWFYAVFPFIPLTALLWGIPMGLAFQMGPRFTISRARLVALLDFLLGETRIDPVSLPPVKELHGWWARQSAPWQCRARAPD